MCEGKNTDKNNENVNLDEIDILGRDEFVDNCTILIDAIFNTTKSAFIMIDGEWGVGKTFVMNMLDKNLKDRYTIIKYNCWENSYYNDPLEAILSVMVDYIDKGSLWSNANKEKFRALGIIALNLLTLGSVRILNKVTEDAKEYISEDESSIYKVIQEVKDYINSNEEKIIILVDEIDRCLPKYGIKTLERLYLLFKDAPNIILVIAYDKSKMEISIKNAFGYKSIDNYLEKFIDYVLKLSNKPYVIHYYKSSLYDKYIILNECFSINSCDIIYKKSVLLDFIFDYLTNTKKIRYIDKLIKFHSNIHELIFIEKKPLPLYIFIIELLIIEFSRKIENFTIENIMNYIKNTDFQSQQIFYFNKLYYMKNNDFKHSIEDSELKWIDILKKVCTSKDDQKVILLFEFIDEIFASNSFYKDIPFRTNFLYHNDGLEYSSKRYFNDMKIDMILSNNPDKYDEFVKHLEKIVNFYWLFNFIEPI